MASNIQVFFDISIGTKAGGRVVFELFNDVAPLAVENFRGLCTGEYGAAQNSGLPLSFKGCKFFRVLPGFMAQSGDFECNNGDGGESVYGGTFRDESMLRRHCQAGVLSMANKGRHTNGSQFLVTFRRAPQLDGKHVAFGQVVQGMEVLRAVEKCPVDANNCPRVPIVIVDCGVQKRLPGMRRNDPKRKMRETVEALMASLAPESSAEKPPTDAQRGLQKLQQALKSTEPPRRDVPQPFASGETAAAATDSDTSLVKPTANEWTDEAAWEAPCDTLGHGKRRRRPRSDAEKHGTSSSSSDDEEEELDLQDAYQKKLYDLRLRLAESRRLNAKEVASEAKKNADPRAKYWNVQRDQKTAMKDLAKTVKKATAATGVGEDAEPDAVDTTSSSDESNDDKKTKRHKKKTGQWNLDESAELIQWRDNVQRKKKANAAKAFGWNVMNTDACYRAHKKRTADLKFQPTDYERQMVQLGEHFYDPTSMLVSAEFQPTDEAKDRLVASVEKDKAKRKAFSRRRMYIEDETVAYINDFNRSFNQKLERAYGSHCVEIRQNLERGSAV